MQLNNQVLNIKKLVDALPDALIAIDNKARVLWWNRATEELLKSNVCLHEQQPIESVLPIKRVKQFCLKGNNRKLEAELPAKPSKRVELSILDYDVGQRLLCVRDITHLHHLEQMRRDFVANVSHELRTPLTVVHGYLEALLDKGAEFSAPYVIILQKIYQQSQRMHKLIEDLLFLARLEADSHAAQESKHLVNVPALLELICEDAKVLSGKRKHKFHLQWDTSLMIYGEEKPLQGAFSNLIFNAVNYTPDKEQIYISWYADAQGAYFVVRDTGLGIEPEHIPRLTERFYRVDKARSRDSGGTGLGLAIVKHVLIRHGAKLYIESEVGKGTSFTCHFPLTRVTQLPAV